MNQLVAQKLGQYGAVANAGLGAAQNTGQFGANTAGNIGGLLQGIGQNTGNAMLAGAAGRNQIINAGIGGLGQIAGNYFGSPQQSGGFNMIGGNPF